MASGRFFFLVVACAICLGSTRARDSRFGKRIDIKKLEEEWNDEFEDSSWHEDTPAWRSKEAKMGASSNMGFDPNDQASLERFVKAHAGNARSGAHGIVSTPGKTEMIFAKLRGMETKKDTEALAAQWRALLSTGATKVVPYVVETDTILFTSSDGGARDLVLFLLDQDAVDKVTLNSKDYYPEGRERAKETTTTTTTTTKKKKKKRKKRASDEL